MNRYRSFKPRLLASYAINMAEEELLVVIDDQPEDRNLKKGSKRKRVWRDSKVETLIKCEVQWHVNFLRIVPGSLSSSP